MTRSLTLLASLILLLGACSALNPMDTNLPQPAPRSFRVIAYLTDAAIPEIVPYEKLTHINYAFLIPNDDGTFKAFTGKSQLERVVSRAHEKDVKVLISVGGWGWDKEFASLAASSEKRAVFVRDLVQFVQDYHLDGADIDWEYPQTGIDSQNFLALITELRAALPKESLLTAAVAALGENADGISAEALALMDFVNLMVYDGDPAYHASMDYAQNSMAYWQGRGLPPEKTVLGVPFYGKPNFIPYKKLIEADPAAAQTDFFDYNGVKQNYNGLPTIRAKTRLALEKGSGIMFWTLEYDSTNDLSLLSAIDQTIKDASK
jgi:chitinase